MHIYIHFPYCLYKCHYCDFNSYATLAGEIPSRRYTDALIAELNWRVDSFAANGNHAIEPGMVIESIFFGGGTPSLMQPDDVSQVLHAIKKNYHLKANCEVTLETNPGTVDKTSLKSFRECGVNRISLGVQSLDDQNLERFGRIHTGKQALVALDAALDVFGERVSCDLIFGFPEQKISGWEADLAVVLGKSMRHVSCYSLTAEAGTMYTRDLKKGVWPTPDEDLLAEMFLLTRHMTQASGLAAYEISNFAREGFESAHNLGYWKYHEFMGLGAGAVGQYFAQNLFYRETNFKIPENYLSGVHRGIFFESEDIPARTAMAEFFMMGLRLQDGILFDDFANLFGERAENFFAEVLEKMAAKNFILVDQKGVRVTDTGRLKLNQVVGEFL